MAASGRDGQLAKLGLVDKSGNELILTKDGERH